MNRIVLLLSLCVIGVSSSIGPKDCAKGEEYWCRDLKTAKDCGATKYCIQNAWEKMIMPKDENEICDTCKKMVAEARDQLLSNETQEEIRQVLEGTCHIYFPIKFLADECIQFVDEYIPQLIEMLASRMDPQTVCATAGLCNAASLQVKLFTRNMPSVRVSTPTDCRDCKRFISDLNENIRSSTKQQVEDRILSICNKVQPFSQECNNLVKMQFDNIYEFLMNSLESDGVCHLVGMCTEINENIPPVKSVYELFLEYKSDPECDFCKAIIQHIKDLLVTNTTEEELKEVLIGLCKSLGSLDEECEQFVNKNFDLIFKFITSEMDPQAICSALGVCSQSSQTMIKPITLLTPAKFIGESNDVNSAPRALNKNTVRIKIPLTKLQTPMKPFVNALPVTKYMPQTLVQPNSQLMCTMCEYALHMIQEQLNNSSTQDEIKNAVKNVCSLLPQTIGDECKAFIDLYGDAIIVLIAQEMDPAVICTALGICSSSSKLGSRVETRIPMAKLTPAVKFNKIDNKKKVMPHGESTCEICEMVMDVVKNLIGDNTTKEAIENALDSVCKELPQQYQSDCKIFIDEYVEELIDLLQTTDAKTICALLELCPGKSLVKVKALVMDGCDTCQTIINFIEKLLSDDKFDADLTTLVAKVCDVLPNSLQDQCRTLIETYGSYILQMLASLADSRTICQDIEFCSRPSGLVHLLGGKKCTYGPAYWCKNRENAKACKAEKHCEKFVWTK